MARVIFLNAEGIALYSLPMTLANRITLARLALIPLILLVFAWGLLWVSFGLLLLFFLGDLLDGYLARSRNEITDLGKFLDPLADKLLGFSLIVWFAASQRLDWWAVWLLFLPNAALLLGSLILFSKGKKTIPARWSGKLAATVLAVGLTLFYLELLLAQPTWAKPVIFAGIGLTYLAALDYIRVGWQTR